MAAAVQRLPHPPTTPPGIEVIEASVDHAGAWVNVVSWRYGLEPVVSPETP